MPTRNIQEDIQTTVNNLREHYLVKSLNKILKQIVQIRATNGVKWCQTSNMRRKTKGNQTEYANNDQQVK